MTRRPIDPWIESIDTYAQTQLDYLKASEEYIRTHQQTQNLRDRLIMRWAQECRFQRGFYVDDLWIDVRGCPCAEEIVV